MAAHQRDRMQPQCLRQRRAQRIVANQHVGGGAAGGADVEYRCAVAQEPGDVVHRLQRDLGIGERDHRRRMTVHDRHHVGAYLIDLAVDETFEIGRAAARIDRRAVQVEFHDVVRGDQRRRHAA